MEDLIPDGERRAQIEAELVELPVKLFQESVPVPVRWCEWSSAYLLLSEDMCSEAERARFLGWTVLDRLGSHLDIVNRSTEVATDLVRIVS